MPCEILIPEFILQKNFGDLTTFLLIFIRQMTAK